MMTSAIATAATSPTSPQKSEPGPQQHSEATPERHGRASTHWTCVSPASLATTTIIASRPFGSCGVGLRSGKVISSRSRTGACGGGGASQDGVAASASTSGTSMVSMMPPLW